MSSRGWPRVTLGELTAGTRPISYGVLKPGPLTPGGVPLLRIQDMAGDVISKGGLHFISPELDEEFRRTRLRGGEVLLSIQGTVGRAAICPADLAGANISRTIAVIQPDRRMLPEFLRYYLHYLRAKGGFETGGSTRASLNISTIRALAVPTPPVGEQRRIVELLEDHLSRLDAAALELARASQRLEVLLAAGIGSAFHRSGGPLRPMGELARWGSGGTPRAGVKDFYDGGTIPWLNSGDLADGLVEEAPLRITEAGLASSSAKWVPPGSVLVAMYGATIGRLGIAGAPLTTNQAIAFATPGPELLASYLFWFLRSQRPHLVAAGKGGAQPNISQSLLKQWQIPVPPLDQQEAAVREADAIAAGIGRMRTQLGLADAKGRSLRKGLLVEAFAGRLA